MEEKNDGGPAFLVPFGFVSGYKNVGPNDPVGDHPHINIANGMSLRDWFAGQAMEGMYAAAKRNSDGCMNWPDEQVVAKRSYNQADTMLEISSKFQSGPQDFRDLGLSVRARKGLSQQGVSTLDQLLRRTRESLLVGKNIGIVTLDEIQGKLAVYGLKLHDD